MQYSLRLRTLRLIHTYRQFFLLVVTLVGFASNATAQRLNFVTSTPRINNFPLIRFKMTATYNGTLPNPSVAPNDINITEDGTPAAAQLSGCDESQLSAVVFCVDASTSIISSAGDLFNVYPAFFHSFGNCIGELRGTSWYALIPFTDTIAGIFPGAGHLNGFYMAGNSQDSSDFINIVSQQPYKGLTNVDYALFRAIDAIKYAPYKNKCIVLTTDDSPIDIWTLDSLMELYNITFYVMELGTDSSPHNLLLTHWTGGIYYQASDSSLYAPDMQQIGELISGEHCVLSYVSPNNCPWYADHTVDLTLNYKGLTRQNTEYYSLQRIKHDSIPPAFVIASPSFISRTVTVSDNFPCQSGLRSVNDSLKSNCILLARHQTFTHYFPKISGAYVDSSYQSLEDSLVVVDSMSNARAVYSAIDSAGNWAAKEILYAPAPDTLAPELSLASSNAGKFIVVATEVRPWDRGLKDIHLAAGAVNMTLDNMQIFSRRTGNAWLHTIDMTKPAHGCVVAVDSAGNIGTYCIDRSLGITDTFPPVIVQDPVVSPINLITGKITELRPNDKGIKNAAIESAPNLLASTISYQSPQIATFSVPIVDSLQPVRAWISASDSVGNAALDTLRYDPLPDENAPVCTVDASIPNIRIFKATELAPWDRGIASVILLSAPTNFTPGAVKYVSRYDAEQTFAIVDQTKPASVVVQATDSVGHNCITTITVNALLVPLVPFQAQSTVDFLTHQAPFDSTATITIVNPNEVPVVVTKISQNGNTGVITSDLASPIVFQSFEKKTFNIRLNTPLLGIWSSNFTLANDTVTLANITAIGITTGAVTISMDTVHSAHTQLPELLKVSVSALPNPINLDSIQFDFVYNGDLISSSLPLVDCSSPNELCNYTLTTSSPQSGILHFSLIRNDRSRLAALSGTNAHFEIPFTTFVTKQNASFVIGQNMSALLSSVAIDTGLVTVGDQCGDPAIRAMMNGNLEAYVKSITPNPASSNADVIIISNVRDFPVSLDIVDGLGVTVINKDLQLSTGENIISIPLASIAGGNYILALKSGNSIIHSLPLQVVR
ncbi:MAG TPA: hypothetical protein VEW28_05460 [Candidatus Kapabacteria bacterium]|nr:hypothetical protein [Candidatus Kapabacteria bacterium]